MKPFAICLISAALVAAPAAAAERMVTTAPGVDIHVIDTGPRNAAPPVVLVGWSQGVQDVAGFVNQFGTGRLAGVVLVDSAISQGAAGVAQDPQAAGQQLRLLDIYARAPEDYLHGMLDAIIVTPRGKAKIDTLVAEGLKTPPATGVAMLIADLFGADRTAAIAKLDVPVLIVTSALARDLDAQKAMAAKIPGARQEVVADAGHAVFVDQPEKFDALLAEFLEQLG
jgi:pimeloyl-ACP methyl ester carboxylesterase